MTFSGLVKSSLIDFPGTPACVLFVPGCNYNCFFCHNRGLIDGSAQVLDPQYVESFLKKRAGLLDGVVITGGEPTLYPDLTSFIKSLKALGYSVKLDSNGSNPDAVSKILSESPCDYYAIDYKAPASRHAQICGTNADAGPVLDTINRLRAAGAAFEVRTTVVPQLSREDLIEMAKELPRLSRDVLNKYRVPEIYPAEDKDKITAKPYTKAQIAALADDIREFQPNITV